MAPWLRAAAVTIVVIALDQVTKAIVRGGVDIGEKDGVLPGVDIVHVRNDGVAFNQLGGGGTIVAVVVGCALVALLLYFATHMDKPLAWLPTGMLLGGALGNIVDRVRDGAVTDFVKISLWPAFNVADTSITFGVILLLFVIERDGAASRT